jgi:hypothetical protein
LNDARQILIFDIDGALCELLFTMHKSDSEISHVEKFAKYKSVSPYLAAVRVLLRLRLEWRKTYRVIILTGRSEPYRAITERWLRRHDFRYDDLIMMPIEWTTFEEYIAFKRKIIKSLRPALVVDDSQPFLDAIADLAPVYLITDESSWDYEKMLGKLKYHATHPEYEVAPISEPIEIDWDTFQTQTKYNKNPYRKDILKKARKKECV